MEVYKLKGYSRDGRAMDTADLLLLQSTPPWGVVATVVSKVEGVEWPAALSACGLRCPSLSPASWVELEDSVPFWGPTALAPAV